MKRERSQASFSVFVGLKLHVTYLKALTRTCPSLTAWLFTTSEYRREETSTSRPCACSLLKGEGGRETPFQKRGHSSVPLFC